MFVGRVVGDNTHEFGLYLGAVPLLLAVWVIARRRELGRLATLAWAALAFAAVTLILSFGQYGVLYWLPDWLPLLRTISFPLPLRGVVPAWRSPYWPRSGSGC